MDGWSSADSILYVYVVGCAGQERDQLREMSWVHIPKGIDMIER